MDGRPAAGTPQTAQAHGGWQHGSPPQPLQPAGPPAHPPTHPPSLPLWPGLHWGFPAGPMHPQLPIRPMMMMPPMGLPPPPQGWTGPSSGFEPPAYFPSPIASDRHAVASPSFLHSAPAPVVQQGLPRDPWGVGSQEEPESSAAAPAAAVPAAAQSGRAAAAAPGQRAAAGPAAGIEALAAAGLEGQGRLRVQQQYEVGRTAPAELRSQDMLHARDAAQHRLQQLYPRLPPLVRAWLMHRLIAWLTLVDKEARVRIKSNIVLPLASAVAACDTLALASTHDVVEQTASLLEELRRRFMAGEDLRDTVARHLVIDIGTKRHSKYVAQVATAKVAGAETLEAQVMQLVLDPSLAALNTNPANGGAQQAQALPPPQQPAPTRGALSQPPEPLRQLFLGGDGGKLLEQLLRHALTKDALPVAAALAPWRPDEATVCQQQQQQLPLSVSPDVDFGTVCVASLDAEALQAAAASVAAGLPRGGGRAQAASAGSVLDLLHLSAAAGGAGGSCLRHLGGASGSSNASTGAAMQPVSTAAPVLHYRQIVVDNKSEAAAGPPGATDIWLLGGMAAPSFPHTFTVLDDACLFWLDGHQAVRLAPKQQHTITVALSSADCAARQQESGIMQQLLLLIFAVPLGSAASQALAAIHGVAMTDVFGAAAGAGGGPVLAAQAGLQAAGALAGSYRLFVVVRRVTVALIDRPADLAAQLLDVDAKPFISDRLRRLFDDWPSASCLSAVPAAVEQLLETGDFHESYAQVELPPAASQKGLGLAAALDTALSGLLEAPLLLRYSRLLVLEEEAMERDICRYDAWHVRLRLAVFAGSTSRYHLLSLTPHGTGSGTADQRRGTSVYRGPAVELLQPGGVAGVGAAPSSAPLYVLAVLDVPGLPEGRPGLLTGDAVYLRTAHQPQREIVALVAATEGSSCFLLMPLQFWQLCDVAPLVPMLRTAEGSCGGPGLLDGLVHVRFGFNRVALRSMQHAVAIAAGKQQDPHTCWVPSLLTPFQPRAAGMRSREQEVGDQALRARLKLLQPQADEVAATAAALAERGKQKLNAEQRHTVAAVLCGAGRAFPFALNGPPGTGKTVTLVECALQIMQAYPHARLLLCAPQNYSADLMCSAMAAGGIKQGQMLRLNDPRRPVFTVKDDVLPFCCFSEHTRMFSLPAEVSTPRVIVATCGAAGMLLQEPHTADPVSFTHVLIDEAGQALLPEALIPLSLLMPASSAGQVGVAAAGVAAAEHKGWGAVLCGDPRQLGPVVRSHAAAAAGLTTSLLEVCIGHHSACAYEVMRMGRVPPTAMLVRNYRSHARLLELPSKLFYKSSLQAAADPQSVLPPRWQELQVEAGSHGWQGGRASAGKLPHTAHQTAGGTTSDQHAAVLGAFGQSQQPAISAEEAKAGKTAEHDAPTTPAEEDEEEEVALGPADAEVAGAAPWEGQQGEQNLEEEEREEDAEVENWDEKAGQDADYDEEEDDDDEDEEEEEEEDHVTEEDTGASLLFYGVRGQQMREGDAPSYFNPLEASSVVSLVSGLLGSGAGVQPDDIGVMATYRKQVQKIRLLLRQRGLGSIRVGTVDDYQGQEERIIFISTTLSKPESLPSVATAPQPPSVPMSGAAFAASDAHESGGQEAGADRNLGFWRNPKRFNVAITRAKALLVVVGHPAVLLEDSSWRELLRYCFSNGAYRGAGSDSLRQRFRVDVGAAAGALPDLPAGDEGAPAEADDWELQRAINQLAELALLGGGHADQLFPDSLDEMYAAALDEAPFRVVL